MAQFVEGDKVRTGNVRSVAAQYRNAEGVVTYTNREWIFVTFPDGSQHKFYERELTPAASAKSLLRAKYKASGVAIRENMNPTERAKLEAELRKLYIQLYDGDISAQMRIADLEDRYPEMQTLIGRKR